jgi:hypothetical protein
MSAGSLSMRERRTGQDRRKLAATSVKKGKPMSNDRCRFAMLAGLGAFLILAPACGQSGQVHSAADAAPTNGDVGTADAPIFTGNDAGPDAAVTGTGTGTGTGGQQCFGRKHTASWELGPGHGWRGLWR